jgi:hypothetical protein
MSDKVKTKITRETEVFLNDLEIKAALVAAARAKAEEELKEDPGNVTHYSASDWDGPVDVQLSATVTFTKAVNGGG